MEIASRVCKRREILHTDDGLSVKGVWKHVSCRESSESIRWRRTPRGISYRAWDGVPLCRHDRHHPRDPCHAAGGLRGNPEPRREAAGLPPLSEYEQNLHWENSVDLMMEGDRVLIRPDPDKMELAFDADELLQETVPKHKIRYMHVMNDKMRNAIKRAGRIWRINPLPRGTEEMAQMIPPAGSASAARTSTITTGQRARAS